MIVHYLQLTDFPGIHLHQHIHIARTAFLYFRFCESSKVIAVTRNIGHIGLLAHTA